MNNINDLVEMGFIQPKGYSFYYLLHDCLVIAGVCIVMSCKFKQYIPVTDMNNINDLVEMGFIQPKGGRMITLHPMLQEIAIMCPLWLLY